MLSSRATYRIYKLEDDENKGTNKCLGGSTIAFSLFERLVLLKERLHRIDRCVLNNILLSRTLRRRHRTE
jgi:hypothetical protein